MVTFEPKGLGTLFTKSESFKKKMYNVGFLTGIWLFSHVEFDDPEIQSGWEILAIFVDMLWIISFGWVFVLLGYIGGSVGGSNTEDDADD